MKAVVKQRKGEGFVELSEVPEPAIGDSDVLVAVNATGICGSDLMILHDFFPGYNTPVILGHEFSGVVKEKGRDAGKFSVGDRVVCETHAYICNNCRYCKSGLYNLCMSRKGFGYGLDGAFTKYVKVREPIVHHIPDSIRLDDAAAMEPLSVVVNALTRNSKISQGDNVLVIGPGPIGLLAVRVAKLSGAKKVTVVGTERSRRRLALASTLGADDEVLDADLRDDFSKSPGIYSDQFDLAVIATGNPDAFEMALRAVRKGGTVIHIGESTKQASFQFSLIEKKNLTVQGSFSHNWPVWEEAISLVNSGMVDLSQLITHKFDLEEWKRGFDCAESREGVKVLIKP
ncbi:MAG: alcohol dehydrogenase catalytic domain-containing protein [Thaumarchaeota archaeon]|nr:alcohol dehydrogenase catalytic domain-containing protein [Nitrososphaerota archaeon]